MNRDKETMDVLTKCCDGYEFTVVFRRNLSDDLHCGGEAIASDVPVGEALLRQFITELQGAFDDCGMAGDFQVVSGPSVSLGDHNVEGRKYVGLKHVPKRCSSR